MCSDMIYVTMPALKYDDWFRLFKIRGGAIRIVQALRQQGTKNCERSRPSFGGRRVGIEPHRHIVGIHIGHSNLSYAYYVSMWFRFFGYNTIYLFAAAVEKMRIESGSLLWRAGRLSIF